MGKTWATGVLLCVSCLVLASPAAAGSVGLVPNNGCLTYSGVIFCDDDLRSTGTGIFDPFLRNNGGGSQPVTASFNTNADSWTQPNMADASQTDALNVSGIGTSTGGTGSTTYWTFIIDINQTNANPLIDLTHLELYSCPTNSYTDLTGCTSFYNLFGGAVTYALDGTPIISDPKWLTYDSTIHPGSGEGDLIVFIPTTSFSITPTGYIALLDGWGGSTSTHPNNDGFEEWKVISGFQCPSGCSTGSSGGPFAATPEPASLWLLGSGLALAAYGARRRNRR